MRRENQSLLGGGRRGVLLTGEFYRRFTGRPGAPESLMEWLYTPEHSLACTVNGRVFYDGCGEFSAVRRELEAGYPEDVRLKKMAARAVLMAQSGQYNYSRCLRRGEYGAARHGPPRICFGGAFHDLSSEPKVHAVLQMVVPGRQGAAGAP